MRCCVQYYNVERRIWNLELLNKTLQCWNRYGKELKQAREFDLKLIANYLNAGEGSALTRNQSIPFRMPECLVPFIDYARRRASHYATVFIHASLPNVPFLRNFTWKCIRMAIILPLRSLRSRLAFIRLHRVEHDLVRILRVVERVALAPVVGYRIGEDVASAIEVSSGDRTTNLRVAFQPVLRVLIPEVESAVRASGAESAVLRMKGDGVDSEYIADIAIIRRLLTMTLE